MSEFDPKAFNLPDEDFLRPENIDNVARALITLMREVVVLNDRVQVLETLLDQKGTVTSGEVDTFAPDEAFEARSAEAMQKTISGVLSALRGEA